MFVMLLHEDKLGHQVELSGGGYERAEVQLKPGDPDNRHRVTFYATDCWKTVTHWGLSMTKKGGGGFAIHALQPPPALMLAGNTLTLKFNLEIDGQHYEPPLQERVRSVRQAENDRRR